MYNVHSHSSSKHTTQELRKLHRAHLQPLDHWQTWHDLVVVALNNYCTLVSCVINLGCQKEEDHMLFRPIQLREIMLESRPEDALVKLKKYHWLTDLTTIWKQEMLAHLKNWPNSMLHIGGGLPDRFHILRSRNIIFPHVLQVVAMILVKRHFF